MSVAIKKPTNMSKIEKWCRTWVVAVKTTEEVIGPFYDKKVIAKFNPKECLIETTYQYLTRLNSQIMPIEFIGRTNCIALLRRELNWPDLEWDKMKPYYLALDFKSRVEILGFLLAHKNKLFDSQSLEWFKENIGG